MRAKKHNKLLVSLIFISVLFSTGALTSCFRSDSSSISKESSSSSLEEVSFLDSVTSSSNTISSSSSSSSSQNTSTIISSDSTYNSISTASSSISSLFVPPVIRTLNLKYDISKFTAGTQYKVNEEHKLDSYTTLVTSQCHFTTELRMYSSSAHNGTCTFIAEHGMFKNISFTAGNEIDVVTVEVSNDNQTFTLFKEVNVNKDYSSYDVTFNDSYKYIRLDIKGSKQIRFKTFEFDYDQLEEISQIDVKSVEINDAIAKLLNVHITKDNLQKIKEDIVSIDAKIESFKQIGGETSLLSKYADYIEYKSEVEKFETKTSELLNEVNKAIDALDKYINDNSLTEDSNITLEIYNELIELVLDIEDIIDIYVEVGDISKIKPLTNYNLAYELIDKYDELDPNSIKTLDFTFSNTNLFSRYSHGWSTQYKSNLLTSGMYRRGVPKVNFAYSAAQLYNDSSNEIQYPVITNGTISISSQYNVINNFKITFIKYSNKSKTITIKCLDKDGGELKSTTASSFNNEGKMIVESKVPEGTDKIVIDGSSSNDQIGIESYKLNISYPSNNFIKEQYYASIDKTHTGDTLWSSLTNLTISTHEYMSSYEDCAQLAAVVDTDPNDRNKILDFYSHLPIDSDWNPDIWNREHVWCQSKAWYGDISSSTRNGGTDLHQIRPLYKSINSSRNNSQYGEISSIPGADSRDSYIVKFDGTKVSSTGTPYGYLNGDKTIGDGSGVFEPLDNVKGDIARILLYMLIRYRDNVLNESGSYDKAYPITNDVYVPSGEVNDAYALLLKWNELDPVDDLEKARNNQVYTIQGNRNPFIDYPEYADLIFKNL